jgi:DNA-binding IclR family transcriptional regulator
MLSILDLFSRDHTVLTAEQISENLGLARTTCYRYTRQLSQAGLLVSNNGLFMLGPRIIELDRRIVESDPLLNAGKHVVSKLADSFGATGLLSTCYIDQIINVFEHQGRGNDRVLSFGRGTTMPIFRTSTSKVILAAMSRGRLKRLWQYHQEQPDCRAIGKDWLSFWKALQSIKQQGYWTSGDEADIGLSGVSAPIYFGNGEIAGSMSLVFSSKAFRSHSPEALGARLRKGALEVSDSLSARFGKKRGLGEALIRAAAKKRSSRERALV